jgi:AsmA protein
MKKLAIAIGVVIVLLVVLVILLPFIIDLNRYQAQYLPRIEKALNRKVVLKDIRLMIIPRIGVHLFALTILEDPAFGTGPFASFSSLDIGVKWRPLLNKRVEVEEVALRDPVITVIKNSQGVLNISTLSEKVVRKLQAPPPPPSKVPPPAGSPFEGLALLAFDRVSLKNGNIVYRDLSAEKPAENKLQELNLVLKSVGLGKTADLHLTAVVQPVNLPVKLDGNIGPVKENLDLPSINLAVSVGKTVLNVKGSMRGGDVNLVITAPVINTADLPVALPLKKPVQANDLKIAMEARYQLVQVSNLSLDLFGGQISGQGEVTTGSNSPPFDGKIRMQGLQLKPVMETVDTGKVSISGTAAAQLDVHGLGFSMSDLTDSLTGTGHIEAKDGKIEGINLLKEAFSLLRLTGIKHDITDATAFSTIESDMTIKRGIITVERLRMDSNDFEAIATGTVGFDQKLDLKTKLSLSQELSRQISGSNVAKIATTGNRITVPMFITGTLSAPVYVLDTQAIGGKVQEQVEKQVKEKIRQFLKDLKSR